MGLLNAGGAPAVPMTLATLPPFVPKKPRTAIRTHAHARVPLFVSSLSHLFRLLLTRHSHACAHFDEHGDGG